MDLGTEVYVAAELRAGACFVDEEGTLENAEWGHGTVDDC